MFSQRVSDVLHPILLNYAGDGKNEATHRDAPTMSGMNDGQFTGHSCLRMPTSSRFNRLISTLCSRSVCSSEESCSN